MHPNPKLRNPEARFTTPGSGSMIHMFCAAPRGGQVCLFFVNQNCSLGPARARAPIGRFTTDHSVSWSPCPVLSASQPCGQFAMQGPIEIGRGWLGILVAESREVHRLDFSWVMYGWVGGGGVQWETLWWWRYFYVGANTYPYPLCRCCILNHGYVPSLLYPSLLLFLLLLPSPPPPPQL